MGKIISTLITVVVAVGASAIVWVGANLVFNEVRNRWERFCAMAGGALGFLVGMVLSGNRITVGSVGEPLGGFLHWVWLPLVLAAVCATVGIALARTDDPARRLSIGAASGAVIGVGLGLLVREQWQPGFDYVALLCWTVGGVIVGVGVSLLRRKPVRSLPLILGALGFTIGAWSWADLGEGSTLTAIIALAVPLAGVGAAIGLARNPDLHTRDAIDQRSRAVIFIGPAFLFLLVTLVVPAIRTIYLSFFDRRSVEYVGFQNYVDTFQEPGTWDTSNWTAFFTSRLFYIGLAAVVIGVLIAIVQKRRTGKAVELGNPSLGPLLVGGFLLSYALFTALRGTIINNLWWVVTVTLISTALGLAVAVLADNAGLERVAKSIIFMPMAISLVGASIIWRFMYIARDTSVEQTGVMNAFWVGLGKLSTGDGLPTLIVAIVIGLVLLGLMVVVAKALVKRNYGRAGLAGVGVLLVGWLFVRYTAIIGTGVGGHTVNASGDVVPQTIAFIQEGPFNNFWLMVILIWIQTGFAMVILSAAIKAVPVEFIEAARVDGATTSQIFWRITLPQIGTTIGVVVTTLIVTVMKVYDIVKVSTNGQFGTQVLANDMFNQAFVNTNTGRGAALAVILLVSVLPVMYLNIRRMQRES